jgi:5-methylcytosine-specific restriction endonuclease McrA
MARLEIEHIIPLARGGSDDEGNLWLACPICNGHKSDKIDGSIRWMAAPYLSSIHANTSGVNTFDGPSTASISLGKRRLVAQP